MESLTLFIIASIALIVTPGPDIIYVLTRGIADGKWSGVMSAIGVTSGILIHTMAAALGLAVLLKTSIYAFWTLKVVGGLKVGKIPFLRGASSLNVKAKEVVDLAVDKLKHYPALRVVIEGNTGTRGDPERNRVLSQDRADAVEQYLVVTYQVDPNRLRAVGLGGEKPLPRKPGESLKGWRYRLPRVEMVLVKESY